MTQRDRDRLVVLKKVQKKLIGQEQAAKELEISPRQVRRLLGKLGAEGDGAVVHGLRGRPSNRRVGEETRQKIVRVLSQEVYRDFGPTLAAEYLSKKHGVKIGREALRQIMMGAGLWRSRREKVEEVHQWRARRSCRGEMVQWDTSDHDWLEGRGDRVYLIHMIDDATSELSGRFVTGDSTEENMRMLWRYVAKNGRPTSFYTDKASHFQTTPKTSRHLSRLERDPQQLPPTQIGRALRELGIGWMPAHSPQAKGRVERSFGTAQDRLVKGMRVSGVRTLEKANRYLEEEFLPWWNQHLTVAPANPTDAHRPLGKEYDLAASLCHVETRQVANDYTIRFAGKIYQIARGDVMSGLRGGNVRVERRLDGSVAVRFRDRYLTVEECSPRPKVVKATLPRRSKPSTKSAVQRFGNIDLRKGLPVWIAGQIG
jgi:transposase InsO family protein